MIHKSGSGDNQLQIEEWLLVMEGKRPAFSKGPTHLGEDKNKGSINVSLEFHVQGFHAQSDGPWSKINKVVCQLTFKIGDLSTVAASLTGDRKPITAGF